MKTYFVRQGNTVTVVRAYQVPWLFKAWMRNFDAITLGFNVFYKSSLPNALLEHEAEHIRQISKLGIITFYFQYIMYFLSGVCEGKGFHQAYLDIPFEVAARWSALTNVPQGDFL